MIYYICKSQTDSMRPLLFVISFVLWTIPPLIGQYNIDIEAPEYSGFCEEVNYNIELEKLINTSYNDLELVITFSEPIQYVSQSLTIAEPEVSASQIVFTLDDQISCFYEAGEIIITPSCNDLITYLEVDWKVLQRGESIGQSFSTTVLQSPIVDLTFSDYLYSATDNSLTKTLTVTNIGISPVEAFNILIDFDDDFASLRSTSHGTLSSNMLSINESDIVALGYAEGVIPPAGSFDLELVYAVDRCQVRSITYRVSFSCKTAACTSQLIFVDDNAVYDNQLTASLASQTSIYGLCSPATNELVIKNELESANTVLGDVYNLKLILSAPNFQSRRRRFNDCIQFSAMINGIELPVINDNDEDYIIDLSQLTSDPDGDSGLTDLNGDGRFGDLALGDSTSLDVNIIIKDGCQSSYHTLDTGYGYSLQYNNYCDLFSTPVTRTIPNQSVSISDYFGGSFGVIDDFISGDNNQSFVPDQDTFTIFYNIRKSSNISRICESTIFDLTIDVPSSVTLDRSQKIIYYSDDDTIEIQAVITDDTLYQFELSEMESLRSTLEMSFLGSCDLMDDTNYDSAVDVCDQCVEYKTPRFRAKLTKPCDLPCPIDTPDSENVSEDFFVECPDIPELKPAVVIMPAEYYRLTNGYIDSEETERRDPYADSSEINDHIYFDGDTMLVRMPFIFGCQSSISSFVLFLQSSGFPFENHEIIKSELMLIDSMNGNVLENCPADIFLSKSKTQISAFFSSGNFVLPCIQEDGLHYLDITLKLNYDCFIGRDDCAVSSRGTVRNIVDVTLMNGCTKRESFKAVDISINEVFREEDFDPILNDISLSLSLYKSLELKTPIFSSSILVGPQQSEYRHLPILREISYTIPPGYELISDLEIVATSFERIPNPNPNSFLPPILSFIKKELMSLQPTLTQNPDGSQTYSFSDEQTKYYFGKIGDPITAQVTLKSICFPEMLKHELLVEGLLEYVDYAYGSYDTIDYPFSYNSSLDFIEEQFDVADDFQLIDESRVVHWNLSKAFSILLSFDDPSIRISEDEINYYLRYRSSSAAIIDSILVPSTGFGQISVTNTFESDSEVEIKYNSIFVNNAGDTILLNRDPRNFTIYSSSHACGFDTIFYEFGRKASFLDPDCGEIFYDTLVTYSPPGLPQLIWDDRPSEITTSGDNGLAFTISNVGQGDLINHSIIMSGVPQADYRLLVYDDDGEIQDISESLLLDKDTLTADLSVVARHLLSGVAADAISSYSFVLKLTDICTQNKFFSLAIQSESISYCGEAITSPALRLEPTPFVKSNQKEYTTLINSFAPRECDDNVNVQIKFTPEVTASGELMNPQIEIFSPRDLNLIPNGIKVNGIRITNPTVDIRDAFNVYVISEVITQGQNEEILVEVEYNGNCIDVCREDQISAFLFSDEEVICADGNTGLQSYAKGFQSDKTLRWRPIIDVTDYNFDANLTGDSISFDLEFELRKEAEPKYAGNFYIEFFKDLNGNHRRDNDEALLLDQTILPEDFDELVYSFQPSVTVSTVNVCQFTMTFNTERSCACTDRFINILDNQEVQINSSISYCDASEEIQIPAREFDDCVVEVKPNTSITNMDAQGISYLPSAVVPLDSIETSIVCGSCTILEKIYISEAAGAVDILLVGAEDCSTSATAVWNGGEAIPSNFSISWSHDPSLTTATIKDPPSGVLSVTLDDGFSCRFENELVIEEIQPLSFTISSDAPDCPQSFPIGVSVEPSGLSPISIAWSDGETALERYDIMPGDYRFTITDGLGCQVLDSLRFTLPGDIAFSSDVMHPICIAESAGQIMLSSNDVGLEYAIGDQEFSNESILTGLTAGDYTVYVKNPSGCIDSTDVSLSIDNYLTIPTPAFLLGTIGDTLYLNPESIDSSSWIWAWSSDQVALSCMDCHDPYVITPAEDIRIKVTIAEGVCDVQKVVTIRAEYSDLIYAPNIFSPNQDGQNDRFFVYPHATFDDISVQVYDRWGNIMYEATQSLPVEPNTGWDGTLNGKNVEPGIYMFKAIVRRAADESVIETLGTVQVVR